MKGREHRLYRSWTRNGGTSTDLVCGFYFTPNMRLWTPRGTRTHRFRIVLIAMHPAAHITGHGTHYSCSPVSLTAQLHCDLADDEAWRFADDLIINVDTGTVSLGQQTVSFLPDAVYVVRVDEQWQGELFVDDGRFENLGIAEEEAEQLRQHHLVVVGQE